MFLVDSDASTRRDAIQALLPYGFEVMVGDGPFEATTAIVKAQPDLVVLGHSMTHPFGLALVGRLFSLPDTADIPVFVIANTPEAAVAADRAGATRVVTGPVTDVMLRNAVSTQLGLTRGSLTGAPNSVLGDSERLAAVASLRRDTAGNVDLDRFTKLTSDMLGAPVSMVTLIENDRQVYASQIGVPEPWAAQGHAPLQHSYCQYAITSRQPLVIDDAARHPLVQSSPSVSESNWAAYAGIPLITTEGHAVGALCAIDHEPRHWSDQEVEILQGLADILTTQLNATLKESRTGRHL
ncbi:GAF domain-containing protein [Frondihabitans sp. PhB188]|nr:GAF domain-containing protein [Frondihabitans sp. PhB188]